MSSVCDCCFKEPEPIEGDKGIMFYFVVPKETGDPVVLMSNLEFAFKMCADKDHPDNTENMFICQNCFVPNESEQEDDEEPCK